MDVKVLDFNNLRDQLVADIQQNNALLKKHGMKPDKNHSELNAKEEQMIKLAQEWQKLVGLREYGDYKIVILIGESEEE
jgi:hypothetical protein